MIKKLVYEDKVTTIPELIDALNANWEGYEELREKCVACPKYGNDDDYVDKEGHSVISPDWDFHSLRHTHATALVEAGVPLAVIQKRLGHAKIEMTEHYTDHVTKTMERDFQSKLKSLYS